MEKESTFAERLRQLMDERQVSKSQMAEICGKNKSNITRYLQGTYEGKQDVVYKIASHFNINPSWLMGYDIAQNTPEEDTPGELSEFVDLDEILSSREAELVELYRKADDIDRQTIWSLLSRYKNE